MTRTRWAGVLLALPLLASAAPEKNSPAGPEPLRVVEDAMASAVEIPAQAEALVRLAWPDQPGDPRVAAIAREKIVGFGEAGIPALSAAVSRVPDATRADVTLALTQAFRNVPKGIPPSYLAAVETAVWLGPRDARLIAIAEIVRFRFDPAILPIIDAAIEDPEIRLVAINALGAIGNERARFYLERMLNEGEADVRQAAALSLARIGGTAKTPLKTALRSGSPALRLAAARALLPAATPEDLTALHEYVATFPDDEAAREVTQAAERLEKLLEAQQALESASPAPE